MKIFKLLVEHKGDVPLVNMKGANLATPRNETHINFDSNLFGENSTMLQ